MNQQNISYKVLGIMSGTSFDGIDFCISEFRQIDHKWEWSILFAETIPYDNAWKQKILEVESSGGSKLIQLHFKYGHFLGKMAKSVLRRSKLDVDLIASHGHTIFHQIESGFTFQLGHGAAIAASSEEIVVSDFRSLDVALKGQGAPLVPFGDKYLFQGFDCCINIGGIANLSFEHKGKRLAHDIVPSNMVLNYIFSENYDGNFDFNGERSKQGNLNQELFDQLNSLDFYTQKPPKSLGKEWVFKKVIPLINSFNIPTNDKLNTFSKHICYQIESTLSAFHLTNKSILITGGGARNSFLIELLKNKLKGIKEASPELIDFKEALIFSFLGLIRFLEKENTMKSVTGANRNSCGGSIFLP